MGIKYLNGDKVPKFVVFWTISTIKDEKSAAKFHYIKTVSGKVVAQSIAFRVVSVYWLGVAPFLWHLNAKGPTHIGSTCVAHTSPHSAAAVTDITSVTSLRSAHCLANDFHSWINSWIDCQNNVYTIWLSIQHFNQLSNQQLERLFVQLSDSYSNRANALLR